jgi:glycosyltransferase involved in cell wall biosynthesis
MILIDALNIRKGGGLVLLNYLISTIEKAEIEYIVLVNNENKEPYLRKVFFSGNYIISRNKFLKTCIQKYNPTTLFCFGNFAPNFKVKNCKVIVYVHNSLMAITKNDKNLKLKLKYRNIIIMSYFRLTQKHADLFLFQKELVINEFAGFYGIDKQKMKKIPFYDAEQLKLIDISNKIEDQFIYPSNYSSHKNQELLINIWEELALANYYPKLILTINAPEKLERKIELLTKKGLRIMNYGEITHDKMLVLIAESAYCIFPSKVESFGLGLIESSFLKCEIIVNKNIKTEIILQQLDYSINTEFLINVLLKNINLSNKLLVENKIIELINEIT